MAPDNTTRGGKLISLQKTNDDNPIKRKLIVTIGIDNYTTHKKLRNAVNDAQGIHDLFTQELGFTAVANPLLNDQATKANINALIEEELPDAIQEDDALIVFFAGHGQSRERGASDQGYLIPVNAGKDRWSQYIKINTFLESLNHLPARHIVVILDTCHSGFALGQAINSTRRGDIPPYASELLRKKSRHVLTSAQKDQLAEDGGPVAGHSLFTGCLIHGLRFGLAAGGDGVVTTSALGTYIQNVVGKESNGRQTPDFGRFARFTDERGEMLFQHNQIKLQTNEPTKSQISILQNVSLARVQELDALLKNERLAEWAREQLQILAQNKTDQIVASMAAHCLKTSSKPDLAKRPVVNPNANWGGLDWVEVPAGEFWMGSDNGRDNEKPRHRLHLDQYWLSKTPVTNQQYLTFVQATGMKTPQYWENRSIPKGKETHPVVEVSWDTALAYSRWLSELTGENLRLPSEAEWEKCARGTDGRRYPWGDAFDIALCNTEGNSIYGTTSVDRYPRGASFYGAFDMAGNVWEWTVSSLERYPYKIDDGREGLKTNEHQVLRGGSWDDDLDYARTAFRDYANPYDCLSDVGFRLCRHCPSISS